MRGDSSLLSLADEYLKKKTRTKYNVVNAEEVWDFDSGEYSNEITLTKNKNNKKQAKKNPYVKDD